MSNQNISDYVILAEAAYANFSNYKLGGKEELGQAIIDTGKEDDEPNEKSTTVKLADYITSRYDVIAYHHDQAGDSFFTSDILNGSGFSATLFQDKVSKAYVLALKGSKGAQDLIGADLNDIVLDGLAHHQLVDMYNFWQSLTRTEYHPAAIRTDWALTAEYAAERLKASICYESYREAT